MAKATEVGGQRFDWTPNDIVVTPKFRVALTRQFIWQFCSGEDVRRV
jgi:hypothetical protein